MKSFVWFLTPFWNDFAAHKPPARTTHQSKIYQKMFWNPHVLGPKVNWPVEPIEPLSAEPGPTLEGGGKAGVFPKCFRSQINISLSCFP